MKEEIHFLTNDFLVKNQQELQTIVEHITKKPLERKTQNKAIFMREFTKGLYKAYKKQQGKVPRTEEERMKLEKRRVELLEELKKIGETKQEKKPQQFIPRRTTTEELPPPPMPEGPMISPPPPEAIPEIPKSPVQELLDDQEIKEIVCEGPNQPVKIKRQDGSEKVTAINLGKEEINTLINNFAQETNQTLSESQPFLSAILPNGTSVQGTLGTNIITPRFVLSK